MPKAAALVLIFILSCASVCIADDKGDDKEPKAQSLDMVSDTVVGVLKKANALLEGKLDITMSNDSDKKAAAKEFTINAMGQKVPARTAVKSGSALHSDQPL